MARSSPNPLLLIASRTELPVRHRVWGTGGWLPPEQREALDWLTLARCLGWGVTVTWQTGPGREASLFDGNRWVILACETDCVGEELVALLASRLAREPILVVARAAAADESLACLAGVARCSRRITGRSLCWIGPGPKSDWRCRSVVEAQALEVGEGPSVWAMLDGAPLIVTRRVGRGAVATIGFHPSQARDLHGVATALLKHLLIWGSTAPLAWLDLGGSMVLRMDDPGGAQNVHKRNWAYPKLDETQWAMIGNELRRRRARLSLGYVAGWVDDGDVGRGVLHVAGVAPRRVPGWVYPAPLVRYREHAESRAGPLYNYEAEFRGIQTLRAMGLGDVELHGYTHMYPDSVSWAKAPDRYEATAWFRELGSRAAAALAARPAGQHPLALGIAAFRRYFNVCPTTLICPGDEWTNEVLERALDYGLHLTSSYYLALRDGERFCWMIHVCAPYLDEPNPAWFDAGLPVVGYFHDREAALEGVSWISKWLDRWSDAGAQHLMDFRELAGAIGRRLCFESDQSGLHLRVSGVGAPALVRPLTVMLRAPGKRLPAQLPVCLDGGEVALEIQPLNDGLGRVSLPVTAAGIAS